MTCTAYNASKGPDVATGSAAAAACGVFQAELALTAAEVDTEATMNARVTVQKHERAHFEHRF